MPEGGTRLYSSGFGKKKTLPGSDFAEAYIILQQRSEDADGRITARRVGTGRERFGRSTAGWQNGHRLPVDYGDITGRPDYKPWMGLLNGDRAYYARNSRGKMVPVEETGWADADATPTHMLADVLVGLRRSLRRHSRHVNLGRQHRIGVLEQKKGR